MTGSEVTRSVSQRVDRLCADCVRDTQVDGGAVALMTESGARDVLCATNAVAAEIERIQIELGEGPGIAAGRSFGPVLVPGLDADIRQGDVRWPFFAARATGLNVCSLFAFPIRVSNVSVGTLSLHRCRPGELEPDAVGRALAAVELIGDTILAAAAPGRVEDTLTAQVHQAAGMTMIQLGISVEEALALLRATAYAEDTALTDLAADIVGRRRRLSDGGSQ